jgi:DNA mismatch repair protein MutS
MNKGSVIATGSTKNWMNCARYAQWQGLSNKSATPESERTGIPSLKVNFNNVFGYYIEVRNTHKEKVPADWIRKQRLYRPKDIYTQN